MFRFLLITSMVIALLRGYGLQGDQDDTGSLESSAGPPKMLQTSREAVRGHSLMQASISWNNVRPPRQLAEDSLDGFQDPFRNMEAGFQEELFKASSNRHSFFGDPFADLEDHFANPPALPRRVKQYSNLAASTLDAASSWISAYISKDLLIFALVGFGVPMLAEKILWALSLARKEQVGLEDQLRGCKAANFGELLKAARSGDDGQWRSSLELISNASSTTDSFGCTALHVASAAGCVGLARTLLDAKADVEVKDIWEETALHFAVRTGNSTLCELLLEKGAELDAINSDGVTPLVAAAKACNEGVCQLLLDRGATCQGGLSDENLPALLSSLLIRKMILAPNDQ